METSSEFDKQFRYLLAVMRDIIKDKHTISLMVPVTQNLQNQLSRYVTEYENTLPGERSNFHVVLFDQLYLDQRNRILVEGVDPKWISNNIDIILGSNYGLTDKNDTAYLPISDIYQIGLEINEHHVQAKRSNPEHDDSPKNLCDYLLYFLYLIFKTIPSMQKGGDHEKDRAPINKIITQLEEKMGLESSGEDGILGRISDMFGGPDGLQDLTSQFPEYVSSFRNDLDPELAQYIPDIDGESFGAFVEDLTSNEDLLKMTNNLREILENESGEEFSLNNMMKAVASNLNMNAIRGVTSALGKLQTSNGQPLDANIGSFGAPGTPAPTPGTPTPSSSVSPPDDVVNPDESDDDEIPFV